MDYANYQSLPDMFFRTARRQRTSPFLWARVGREFRAVSWSDTAVQVALLAQGLKNLGIQTGDRVALISENRPEWAIADLAIMTAGAITVPAYTTNTVDDHRHILKNTTARVAIVSTKVLADRVIQAADDVSALESMIVLEGIPERQTYLKLITWQDALKPGPQNTDVHQLIASLRPDDVACIIHTSGTGGLPKGVMLSHRNIIANCDAANDLLNPLNLKNERFLSFLPLSHAYEHTAGLMFPISIGAEIYFAQSAETLTQDLAGAKPTLMTAVPRLYEILHVRIRSAIQREGKLKERLFDRAVSIGRKRLNGEALSVSEWLLDILLEKIVRDRVRLRFGGCLKAMISGGAPLNPEIGSFFVALGVRLLQGYGQSEAGPIICCNPPGNIRIDTVGPAVKHTKLKIADDGEILVHGANVMRGYWNEIEETTRTLVDDWLHTGDIGELDADGYLRITDRKRDFIKNAGGDMISPTRVEAALTLTPEIVQAMVFGDQRPYLVAVIVPDPEFLHTYAKAHSVGRKPDADDPELHKMLSNVVGGVNKGLAISERIRRFIVATEPFSVANAQLTPTMKIRRRAIRDAYQVALDSLYETKVVAAA